MLSSKAVRTSFSLSRTSATSSSDLDGLSGSLAACGWCTAGGVVSGDSSKGLLEAIDHEREKRRAEILT